MTPVFLFGKSTYFICLIQEKSLTYYHQGHQSESRNYQHFVAYVTVNTYLNKTFTSCYSIELIHRLIHSTLPYQVFALFMHQETHLLQILFSDYVSRQ